jgi:hypothetical protein
MLLTSCKKEEHHEENENTNRNIFTHSTMLLGQVQLTDAVLCADVIMTTLCAQGVCSQHVNLIESPCADTIEITAPSPQNVKN